MLDIRRNSNLAAEKFDVFPIFQAVTFSLDIIPNWEKVTIFDTIPSTLFYVLTYETWTSYVYTVSDAEGKADVYR